MLGRRLSVGLRSAPASLRGGGQAPLAGPPQASSRIGGRSEGARYEKKQLIHRQPAEFVRRILSDFNAGSRDAATAASHLGVVRARSSVAAHVKARYARLVPTPQRQPRVCRRFRRARSGELWQHDSSSHQGWPAAAKQPLLLTVGDHSGLNLAGRFVAADTTWSHFEHCRSACET